MSLFVLCSVGRTLALGSGAAIFVPLCSEEELPRTRSGVILCRITARGGQERGFSELATWANLVKLAKPRRADIQGIVGQGTGLVLKAASVVGAVAGNLGT